VDQERIKQLEDLESSSFIGFSGSGTAKEFLARVAEREKLSPCPMCVHNNLDGTCKAFPEGIVWIFKHGSPHGRPIPMQKNTIVFEPASPEELENRQKQSVRHKSENPET
jgi:hypothetical protein